MSPLQQLILIDLIATVGCALFGAVYERFSHGVYSYWMLYTFAFPLALGVKILTATTSSGAPPMWNRVFTCSMILIIPMVAVYFVGQKYMYEINLSAGSAGVK